jgi:hypothetical protein
LLTTLYCASDYAGWCSAVPSVRVHLPLGRALHAHASIQRIGVHGHIRIKATASFGVVGA